MKREIKTTLALDGEKAFKQGLDDASRQLRVLGSEMKANTATFAGNGQSLDALTAQGKIFEKQVAQQKEVVRALSQAVKDSADKYGDADKRTDGYRIKLNNATAALAKMERELEQNSQAIKEAGQEATATAGRFDKLKAAAKNLDFSLKNVGDKLSGIGQSMSMAVTAPIVGGFVALTQGTKELRSDLAKLSTNAKIAGQDMEILDDAMAKLQAVTGETDSNVEGLSELLATGFRDEQLTELLDSLYGATIKFSDTLKFEGIADGLQETLATGAAIGPFGELLERSGVVLDDFNAGLQVAIANGNEENYILQELTRTGLAETYEAYRKNNEEMVKAEEANFRMQQSMATLGATLEPILTPIIEKVTELVNRFNSLDPATQKTILVVAGLAAAIGPLLVVVGSALGLFASLTTAAAAAGVTVGALVAPVGLAIAAFAALTAGGVLLYKNWDAISAKLAEVEGKLTDFFTNKIPAAINTAVEWFKQLPERVVESLNQLPENVGYIIGLALGKIVKFGEDAINWAKVEIPNFIENVIVYLATLPERIGEWLQGAHNKVVEWGINLNAWARTTIPAFINTTVNFFTVLPGKMREIGVNLVTGLWNGIQSMIGWIGEKISGFVAGIVAGFKVGLDEHSPSRVMAKIGQNVSLGLAEGITAASGAVDKAISNLLDNTIVRADLEVAAIAAGAGPSSVSNTYNSNYITVQDGEDLVRTLHRLGVRF